MTNDSVKRLTFKERWLLEDERCPNCNHITKRQRGITRQNLKRLITPRLTFDEFLITFMIVMVIILAFSYMSETKECRQALIDLRDNPSLYCSLALNNGTIRTTVADMSNIPSINFSQFIINETQ